MAFTEHTLNYVLPCIIEHSAKPCRVLNNWFQLFFPSPCRLNSQWPLALSSFSTPRSHRPLPRWPQGWANICFLPAVPHPGPWHSLPQEPPCPALGCSLTSCLLALAHAVRSDQEAFLSDPTVEAIPDLMAFHQCRLFLFQNLPPSTRNLSIHLAPWDHTSATRVTFLWSGLTFPGHSSPWHCLAQHRALC